MAQKLNYSANNVWYFFANLKKLLCFKVQTAHHFSWSLTAFFLQCTFLNEKTFLMNYAFILRSSTLTRSVIDCFTLDWFHKLSDLAFTPQNKSAVTLQVTHTFDFVLPTIFRRQSKSGHNRRERFKGIVRKIAELYTSWLPVLTKPKAKILEELL